MSDPCVVILQHQHCHHGVPSSSSSSSTSAMTKPTQRNTSAIVAGMQQSSSAYDTGSSTASSVTEDPTDSEGAAPAEGGSERVRIRTNHDQRNRVVVTGPSDSHRIDRPTTTSITITGQSNGLCGPLHHQQQQQQQQLRNRPRPSTREEQEKREKEEGNPSSPASASLPQVRQEQSSMARQQAIPIVTVNDENEQFVMRLQQNRDILLRQLSLTLVSGRLTLINLSRRGLLPSDATLVKEAITSNPTLTVLKLSYNDFGDAGAAIIGSGFMCNRSHHKNLSTLDIGFNGIGNAGCTALALHAVAGNPTLHTLYLSGNCIEEKGAMALAGAILHGCNLTCLHLSNNRIKTAGIQMLARAIAERESHCQKVAAAQSTPTATAGTTTTTTDGPGSNDISIQELYVANTSMDTAGFLTIPSMLLTNNSMRKLCLANNGLSDNDVGLLAQSLSRNKKVPLESLQLSFNEITCVGVECIMNAVWGSKTLRELLFDNNKIRDRGAQLAAVVLTSINLHVIDLSFNKVTAVGVKALMKSMSENSTLQQLGLSGIPLDLNSAKALSYGLAYNSSLTHLHVNSCSIGYSAQRHIVAGIVSNKFAAFRVLTGFRIGAISVTLGLPQIMENWSNDQVLTFVRMMWQKWRAEYGVGYKPGQSAPTGNTKSHSIPGTGAPSNNGVAVGPAAPSVVVAAAKNALSMIGQVTVSTLKTEPYQRPPEEGSPLVQATATLLEKTLSGTVRVPPVVEGVSESTEDRIVDAWTEATTYSSRNNDTASPEFRVDPNQKQRNLLWLRQHFRELHEIGRLPFHNADLWQLHQYFFSPLVETEGQSEDGQGNAPINPNRGRQTLARGALDNARVAASQGQHNYQQQQQQQQLVDPAVLSKQSTNGIINSPSLTPANPPRTLSHSNNTADVTNRSNDMSRSISFQTLNNTVASAASPVSIHSRRRSLATMEGNDDLGDNFLENENLDELFDSDEDDDDDYSTSSGEFQPANKRAKNFKPRIAYYPRIRSEIESLGQKAAQHQVLSLLRQLKFAENVMFEGRDVYLDNQHVRESNQPMPADVEMVLLDLL